MPPRRKLIIVVSFDDNTTMDRQHAVTQIQKVWRGYRQRRDNMSHKDKMTKELLITILQAHIELANTLHKVNKDLTTDTKHPKKIRIPNFPSDVSENIAKHAYASRYGFRGDWNKKPGDFMISNVQCEVKGFISKSSPLSFGPTEKWDKLFFVDSTKYMESHFTVYLMNVRNDEPIWKSLKMNKTQTFEDQAIQGRRPRLSFNNIIEQTSGTNVLVKIWEGHISQL